jgi:hypothetical protein
MVSIVSRNVLYTVLLTQPTSKAETSLQTLVEQHLARIRTICCITDHVDDFVLMAIMLCIGCALPESRKTLRKGRKK